MAIIMPPKVNAIVEPAVAPLIVTNAVALDFKHEAVWLHVLTKHWVSEERREFRREAILCFTPGDFLMLRRWLQEIDYRPSKPCRLREDGLRAH